MATATQPTNAKVIDSAMYVCVSPVANNNKFWRYERLDACVTEPGKKGVMETGDLRITWGRVGDSGESQLKMYDEKWLAKKIKEKMTATKDRPEYSKVNTVGVAEPSNKSTSSGIKVTSEQIKKTAVAEIAGGCPITAALVKKLAETNKHELVAATGGLAKGGMDIDLETGLVRTALGVVTSDAIGEARGILDRMLPFVKKNDTDNVRFTDFLGSYLRLIPQDVGTRRKGWHTDFINIAAQSSLLDQLETSVELAEQRIIDAAKAVVVAPKKSLFECKLRLVDESLERGAWEKVKKAYFETVNYNHASARLKPVRMYEVTIPHMIQAFEQHGRKLNNIKELWHGSRCWNLLSILSRGFCLPNTLKTQAFVGAMYSRDKPGLYFSSEATKSLNYSQGSTWDNGPRDNNCYMFRVDVAMGREYIPLGACGGPPKGYDSIHAVAGRSGIRNDEQVIFSTHQCNPRYLVEFSS